MPALLWCIFTLIDVVLVQYAVCLKFLRSLLCSSKSFLNSRLSSTRLLINWFLIEKCVVDCKAFEYRGNILNHLKLCGSKHIYEPTNSIMRALLLEDP